MSTFDLVTVGGGIGGASLARTMAARGARVLVVERERRFADRVRGEALMPWGVAEARALGIEALLRERCAHDLRWIDMFFAGAPVVHRDLAATTPRGTSWVSFYHPAMQEALLEAACAAGADVRRGARVREVRPGNRPWLTLEVDGQTEEIHARLIVGADGRGSLVRRWGGFAVSHDPDRLLFSGVLLDDLPAADDAGWIFFNPPIGRCALFFPQDGGRARAYVGYHKDTDPPRGAGYDLARFAAESVRCGADAAWFESARAVGPLATFDGADSWVAHPYRDGVALIGDAAATSDPTWGQGMSLTLRDVRTLGAWRMAHLEGILNGLTLIGVAAVADRLTLGARGQRVLFWALVVTAWGNMIASLIGPLSGARGLEFGGGVANSVMYLLFVAAIVAVVLAMWLVSVGAFRSAR